MSKLTLILILLTCASARSTTCMGPVTVCSSFGANSIVFRGRLLEAIPTAGKCAPVTYPDGSKTTACEVPITENFRFEVLEAYKGAPGREIVIAGGNNQFRQGPEYIVFASPNPASQAAQTSICSGSHIIEDPERDADLVWLRAYPNAPPTASIFGKVVMGYGVTAIPSISIKLSEEKNLTATSAEDHSYAFKNLPPGTYIPNAVLPAGFAPFAEDTATATVAAKGCAEIDWAIRSDTHIKGTVTDAAGNLTPDVHVGLLRPAQNRNGFDVVTSGRTDAGGNYDFSKVDPGEYWVALYYLGPNSREPYAAVYYPAALDSASAKLIHLRPSATVENINLILGPALHSVSLHIHVVNRDGTPVEKAHVIASDPLIPTQAMTAIADEHGDADITLYEGREYRLIASTSGYREPGCAGPVKFIAKEKLQLDALILDKAWNECRSLQRAH